MNYLKSYDNKVNDGNKMTSVTKSFAWTFISLIFIGLSQFLFSIIVSRMSGKIALSVANSTISLVMLISIIISFTIGDATSKVISQFGGENDKERTKIASTVSFIIYICIISVFIIALVILQEVFSVDLPEKYSILLPLLILGTCYYYFRGAFYGFNRLKLYAILETISSILLVVGTIVSISLNLSPLFGYYALFGFFSLCSIIIFGKNYKLTSFEKIVWKRLFLYILFASLGSLAAMRVFLSSFISGVFLGYDNIGLYSSAIAFASILSFFPSGLNRVLLMTTSRKLGESNLEEANEIVIKTVRIMSLIQFFLCTISIILNETIIKILYGIDFIEASSLIIILAISSYFPLIAGILYNSLAGIGKGFKASLAPFTGLLFSLISWIFLIPLLGELGTAIGLLIGNFVYFVIIFPVGGKYFKLPQFKILSKLILRIIIFLPFFFLKNTLYDWLLLLIYIIIYVAVNFRDVHFISSYIRTQISEVKNRKLNN